MTDSARSLKFGLMTFSLFFFLAGCVHSADSEENGASAKQITIKPFTEITAAKSLWESRHNAEAVVTVPKELFLMSALRRDHVELREGPGAGYAVKDRLLSKGEKVLVFDRIGVWRRVYALSDGSQGWLHVKMINGLRRSKEALQVAAKDLPVLYAVNYIKKIYSFPEEKIIDVNIPKGTTFSYFKKTARQALVWIKSTNSVAWMSREDLK
jgi:hypothetical protein